MDRTHDLRRAWLAVGALALIAAACDEEPADETVVRTTSGGPEVGPVPPHLELHPVHVRIARRIEPPEQAIRAREVQIRTVLFERGESTGRLLFFREDVTCSAIPTSDDDRLPTLVLLVGVRTVRPGWEGALDTTEWHRWDPVPLSEGVEWSVELEDVGDESATGHIRALTSGAGRAFVLDDDFSAVICAPTSRT
jgi:hypothetical protein